ncbi:STAS domain-containing protein [Luteibacter sp. PPL201]|uniref:STAS domain-containing protein n=1 Tax=Luteibacter sahnii TaxID=3021977 RepID=A0ABT6BFC6_9GAMM|nr:STAS domain-containing protein [Luteibacter sp. PPL193]MDY1549160.1 STAS domain-containing protein [Luteibacter sp. PPL193]
MSQPAFQLSTPAPDTLAVSGALTFDTASRALDAGRNELDRGAQHVLDLAGVTQADSAGLATVLALLAHGRAKGRDVTVAHAPAGLQALARVSGVDSLL